MNSELTCAGRTRLAIKQNLLLFLTLLAVICGFGLGIGLYYLNINNTWLLWVGFPGELMLRAFKLLILPLVISSVISITAGSSAKSNGKLGILTIVYIVLTNLIGAALGLILVAVVRPGALGTTATTEATSSQGELTTSDIIADLFRNLIPDNIVTLNFEVSQTSYRQVEVNGNVTYTRTNGTSDGMNLLGAMFTAALFGLAAARVGERSELFKKFFEEVAFISTFLLSKVVWLLPIGLFSLIAKALAEVENMEQTFVNLGAFMATVAGAIIINQFVIHIGIYLAFVRQNPLRFYPKIIKPYLVAFSATSSVTALPVMLESVDLAGLRPRISKFVLPLCCNSNADGSCAFIAAAVTFVAQFSGVQLSFGNYILIVFLSGISGLSLPAVPSSSMVVIIGILANLGIPAAAVSLLYSGEFILDRIRTGCNTWSHCTCAAVMSARLPLMPEELEEQREFREFHISGDIVPMEDGDSDSGSIGDGNGDSNSHSSGRLVTNGDNFHGNSGKSALPEVNV